MVKPTELFLILSSAALLVYQKPWHVLSCLWDIAYKRSLHANREKVVHVVAAVGFLSF